MKPGDRVALLLSNSVEFMECFYRPAKIGGIVVLLYWRLVADELEYLLVNSGATTLVFGDNFAPVVTELRARATTAVTNWVQVVTGSAPTVSGNPASLDWALDFHALRSAASIASPGIRAGGDDVLCLCYSSGTTGLPKGVMLTHEGQMWAVFSNLGSSEDFNLAGRYLMVMPMFHLGGLLPVQVAIFGGSTVAS